MLGEHFGGMATSFAAKAQGVKVQEIAARPRQSLAFAEFRQCLGTTAERYRISNLKDLELHRGYFRVLPSS